MITGKMKILCISVCKLKLDTVCYVTANLKELKLRFRFCCSIVVGVKLRQIFPDGGLVHLIKHRHWEVVLHSEISLPMELQHQD